VGSERGLSTSAQIGAIGANQNGSLASTSRPTKALGPWWEDLNTDQSGLTGTVRYETIGSSPDRILVIQWSNMRAYWDATTTSTRVSFQVMLYETSNKIEFIYGPVQEGSFAGQDIGASIGMKDHIGGDYHFYDIPGGGILPASDVVTDLSPLTDWPGPDSAFVIQSSTPVSVNESTNVPSDYSLYQNYPNPFNPSTKIGFVLLADEKVNLSVFNLLGEKVGQLLNEYMKSGFHEIEFDAANLSSGVYFYKLSTDSFQSVKKMILLH